MMQNIDGKTKLIGLLGDPVRHSLSPVMQNAALQNMHLNWTYMAFPCKNQNLNQILNALLDIDCKGLNITIPHKNSVALLCNELSPLAARLNAVNTLLPNKNGGWFGTNTDVEGFLFPLKNIKHMKKDTALIIGCGGSSRAILAGLQDLSFKEIYIVGRASNSIEKFMMDAKKNNLLTSQTKCKALLQSNPDLASHIKEANLIVNTTPIGMKQELKTLNEMETIPLGKEIWKNLSSNSILYDLIYTPKPTEWLNYGGKIGCKTIDGLEMLIQQGAASLRLWSGINEIPINKMRNAAENLLKI